MQFIHLAVKNIGVSFSIRDYDSRFYSQSVFKIYSHPYYSSSFQEKMRSVVMRLLGKILVTRIVVYVMINNLNMISGNFALGF